MPPRRTWPNSSTSARLRSSARPRRAARPRRRRRSRTSRPRAWRALQVRARPRRCRTAARGRGSRRRRRRCREWQAIQPAWRPITSTTITRLCDSAVVCRRSIASVAICTAVSKPNVKSVPARSLSIVFGTPTTGDAVGRQPAGDAERVLAADRDQRVDAGLLHARRGRSPCRPRRPCTGWSATCRGSCRRAAGCRDVASIERSIVVALDDAGPAVAEADELVAVDLDALADDAADHRVEAGAVAAAGEDADSGHAPDARTRRKSAVTRVPAACRPGARPPAADVRRRRDERLGLRGDAVAPPLLDGDLDRGGDRDREQRADDAEQRPAEQDGDEDDERLELDRALLDLRLDDVVLELLVGQREHDPDDRGGREVGEQRDDGRRRTRRSSRRPAG